MSQEAGELNRRIIRLNTPRLEKGEVFHEIRKRLGGDPTKETDRIFSYVLNLLVWQKELVIAQMFELFAGRSAKTPEKEGDNG